MGLMTLNSNPPVNFWDELSHTDYPYSLDGAACASYAGRLYVFGGSNGSSTYYDYARVYDPVTKVWTALTALPSARAYARAVAWNGSIYIFGGRNSGGYLTELQQYNITNNNYTALTAPPDGRGWSGVTLWNNRMYIFGGNKAAAAHDDIWYWDLALSSWTTVASTLPNACAACAAATVGNYIYIHRGTDLSAYYSDFWRFDPVNVAWATMLPLPGPVRCFENMVALNNTIYVFGGYSTATSSMIALPQKYSVTSNKWSSFPSPSAGISDGVADVIGDAIFTTSGDINSGFNTKTRTYNV